VRGLSSLGEKGGSNPFAGLFASSDKRTFLLCLLLLAATLVVYNPVNQNGFINFDDNVYITQNPHVRAGLSWPTVKWAFSTYAESNWHPLTWLSHALDYQLFRSNAAGHHDVNVLLHAANAILLFLVLTASTGYTWRSLLVAALFALHPIQVESVAWAAERKNVLSMFFLLLAFAAYGWYAHRPTLLRYSVVAVLFACGLMSKPQIVTLPLALLLWDYWPLGRMRHRPSLLGTTMTPMEGRSFSYLCLEKLPLLALSAVSAVVTVQAQKADGSLASLTQYPFGLRLENAIVACARYLGKLLWPSHLSALYPHPVALLPWWQVALSAGLMVAITLLVSVGQRRYLLVGWLWFLGTLVPMMGLVQVGYLSMADRYAYLPFVGLFVALVWGFSDFVPPGAHARRFVATGCALLLLTLGWLSRRQVMVWRTSLTLWTHALAVTPPDRSYWVHFWMAQALAEGHDFDGAIWHFRAALDPREKDPRAHLALGLYDQKYGHLREAVDEYQKELALVSVPELRLATFANLGSAYRQLGDERRAQASFEAALQLDGNFPPALLALGVIAQKQSDVSQAEAYYSRLAAVEPSPTTYLLLAQIEQKLGRSQEAEASRSRAAGLTSDLGAARQEVDTLLNF
jgi:Flp pilus assembly protein TadD